MSIFDFFRRKFKGDDKAAVKTRTASEAKANAAEHASEMLSKSTSDAALVEIVPVEERVKTAIASSQGLYPHELLLLAYAHHYDTDNTSFQDFWWQRYGVKNVKQHLESLLERGFLKIGELRAEIEKLCVRKLKYLLNAHELGTRGKKEELVERILDAVSIDALNVQFSNRTYELTESGQAALREAAYVPYIHHHKFEDLDIWSLNLLVHSQPYGPFRDKIWAYLKQKSAQYLLAEQFASYAACRYSMYQWMVEQNKYDDALYVLSEIVFYHLNGLSQNHHSKQLDIYAQDFFPYKDSSIKVPSGILSAIVDCQKKLLFSDEDLKMVMRDSISELSAALKVFTAAECADIVILEKRGDLAALTKTYAKAEKRFKRTHP